MAKRKRKFRALRMIVPVLAAGAVGSAIAVYVTGGVDGNNDAARTAAGTAEATCRAKAETARRVGQSATGAVAAMLAADPPRALTSLSFKGPDGKPMAVSDFAGKTILMNLWATWCTPCREEMPALDALQAEKGSENFEVVAVNVDRGDDEKPRGFLDETGIQSLAYYRDSSMQVFNDLKSDGLALGLPVTLLIDEDGCLIANMNGPAEWDSPDAARLVDAALDAGG